LWWHTTGLLAFQELLITEAAMPLVWFSTTYVFLFINLKIYSSIQEKGCDDNPEGGEISSFDRSLLPNSLCFRAD
jgi:hypothetical protein